jgi:hypothetical protein
MISKQNTRLSDNPSGIESNTQDQQIKRAALTDTLVQPNRIPSIAKQLWNEMCARIPDLLVCFDFS